MGDAKYMGDEKHMGDERHMGMRDGLRAPPSQAFHLVKTPHSA
jgi:hypothetical protein